MKNIKAILFLTLVAGFVSVSFGCAGWRGGEEEYGVSPQYEEEVIDSQSPGIQEEEKEEYEEELIEEE